MGINQTILVGVVDDLPRSESLRPDGTEAISFTLRTVHPQPDVPPVQFRSDLHTIRCSGPLADLVREKAPPGTLLYVSGRIRYKQHSSGQLAHILALQIFALTHESQWAEACRPQPYPCPDQAANDPFATADRTVPPAKLGALLSFPAPTTKK